LGGAHRVGIDFLRLLVNSLSKIVYTYRVLERVFFCEITAAGAIEVFLISFFFFFDIYAWLWFFFSFFFIF